MALYYFNRHSYDLQVTKHSSLPFLKYNFFSFHIDCHTGRPRLLSTKFKADPFAVRFFFGLTKPKKNILGGVFSGEIEAIGSAVKLFKVGGPVFGATGMGFGAYAEYKCLPGKPLIAFTDKAKPYLLLTSEKDKKVNIQKVKIADEEFANVTGIQTSKGSKNAVVEYTTAYENVNGFSSLTNKDYNKPHTNKADFALYDDGWRLEKKK